MKKEVFICFVILFFASWSLGLAQPGRTMWYLHDTDLNAGCCQLSKYELLENANLKVTYCFRTLRDTLKVGAKFDALDTVALEIGDNFTKFYGLIQLSADSSYVHFLNGDLLGKISAKPIDTTNFVHYQIFRDVKSKKLTYIDRMPFKTDLVVSFDEPIPAFNWQLTGQTKEIYNYKCQEAVTTFGGRKWTVWFTPEIPINAGPWKFSGLPGLILEAYDLQNHFVINVIGLSAAPVPIYKYLWKTLAMTKEKWQKYEYELYTAPLHHMNVDADFYVYNRLTGDYEMLDDSWSVPYNPIEKYSKQNNKK